MGDLYRFKVGLCDCRLCDMIRSLRVPVETVGTLTVKDHGEKWLRADFGDGGVALTNALPPGRYLIVEADDE